MNRNNEEGFTRCNICDYCSENQDVFHLDKKRDEYVCLVCYREIQDTLRDYEERDEYLGIKTKDEDKTSVKTDSYDDMSEEEIDQILKEMGCEYVNKDR